MRNARSVWLAIFLGGLVAGTVDIGAASLISGRDPLFILHVIAGGLIGKDAAFFGRCRDGGAGAAAAMGDVNSHRGHLRVRHANAPCNLANVGTERCGVRYHHLLGDELCRSASLRLSPGAAFHACRLCREYGRDASVSGLSSPGSQHALTQGSLLSAEMSCRRKRRRSVYGWSAAFQPQIPGQPSFVSWASFSQFCASVAQPSAISTYQSRLSPGGRF